MSELKHTPGVLIPGYPGYTVTRHGRVFSIIHNWRGYGIREMSQTKNYYGYPSVRLTVGESRKRVAVHKLVALAFIPKPEWATEIRHLDGNKNNNHVDNLVWGNAKLNAADRERHGRTSRGYEHAMAVVNGQIEAGFCKDETAIVRLEKRWSDD